MASENNVVVNFLVGEPEVRKTPGCSSEKKGAAIVGEMKSHLDFSLLLHLKPPQKSNVFILCSFSYMLLELFVVIY